MSFSVILRSMRAIVLFLCLLARLSWAMDCRDIFSIEPLGDSFSGNELRLIQIDRNNGTERFVEKRYAEKEVLQNDVKAIHLLSDLISKAKHTFNDLEVVEILKVKDPHTVHISYAKGSVVENLFERQRINSMPDMAREHYHRLREASDQPSLRQAPTDLEKSFLDNPKLMSSLREKYVDLLKRLDLELKRYSLSENIDIIKYEVDFKGSFPSMLVSLKRSGVDLPIHIYIKPDNLVLTNDLKFMIFDPY